MTVVNPKSISGINSITTGSGSDNLLTIHTSDASSTERVRINSSGDVIVGSGITVSPDGDIFATGVTTSTTFSGNFSGGTVSGTTGTFTGDVDIADKIVHTGDTNTAIRFPAADTITAETGGSERARIDSSGRFLIGTNSSLQTYGANPSLQVAGTSFDTSTLLLRRDENNANPPAIVLGKSRGSAGGNTVVQDDDQVGSLIFAAADGTDLTSIAAEIKVQIDGTPGSNDVPGRITFNTTADGASNPTERLRINSSGQLFLGATSTDHVNRTFISSRDSGNYISIITDANDNCGITFGDSTTGTGNYESYIAHANSTNDFTIYTSQGSKSFAFKSGGDLSISDGNLVIGTSGHGIDFSATGGGDLGGSGTSELLDDYEEGTCTFTFVPASGSYGAVYTTGHYTKIGDIVHVTGSISINGATGASGEVQISGLPFSVRGVNSTWSGEGGHGTGRWFYGGPNHFVHLVCDNSTDRMRVHKADGTFLNHTDMNTGYNASQYSFTATYFHV